METQELVAALGYAKSPNFLPETRFDEIPAHAHIFRRAARRCSVQGVYLLRDESVESSSATPVVYIAQAEDSSEADTIHRQIWNQSAVPFLMVRTPKGVRLYSGFSYEKSSDPSMPQGGVLETLVRFHEVAVRLAEFRAEQIDNGNLWRARGHKVQPENRVDHRLLANLETIGQQLHQDGVPRQTAHALIGKLVYLRYLRDRKILSDRRLKAWGIAETSVFGRDIRVAALADLVDRVDDWLNGEIFPLSFEEGLKVSEEQVERTAAIFLGDDARTGQLHLDFQAYDFSHIPIETLSSIYEQFLAIEGTSRKSGAFYTPIPVVNFMISEMEDHKPLESGMRVLDPACGSGAFLVQCYRHLIEKQMAESRQRLRPAELRGILVEQIFGVDRDEDACRVAQMSLVLTMLDYIDPPDLQSTPHFKLPKLHNKNIYQSDVFEKSSAWAISGAKAEYDWIIGNPPWIELSAKSRIDRPALEWQADHGDRYPVTKRQTAEMFAWKAASTTGNESVVGLLLPAMTLFKQNSIFRKKFFSEVSVLGVANFTNLRRDLFVRYVGGKKRKMEVPAASLFFRRGSSTCKDSTGCEQVVPVYSPLLLNQEAVRPKSTKARAKVWDLSLNSCEVKLVDAKDLAGGSMLPWKVAMWGGHRDYSLLKKAAERNESLGSWAAKEKLVLAEGPQLRQERVGEATDPVPIVVGKKRLVLETLRNAAGVHALPDSFVEDVPAHEGFVRRGRKELPLSVCFPPHVIVSATRAFAVYSEEFLVVPPRQIGVAGAPEKTPLLKALALFLSSDFASYFEFFYSPQGGVSRGSLSTLGTLKRLPVPFAEFAENELLEWVELQRELAASSRRQLGGPSNAKSSKELVALEEQLNLKVEAALGLSSREHWLVHDLVHIRMSLVDGNLGEPAIRRPSRNDLLGYGEMLRDEMDSFVDLTEGRSHRVTIYSGSNEGFVSLELIPRGGDSPFPIKVRDSNDAVAREMNRLQEDHRELTRQWIYFDRNLFVYDHDRTLIFKPQQRFWWTRSQAMSDADEVISAALAPEHAAA